MIIKLHRLNKRWLSACVHPWLTSRTPRTGEFLRPNSQVSGLHVRANHHQPGRVLSATVTYTTTGHVQNLAKKIMKRRMLDWKIKKNNSNSSVSFKNSLARIDELIYSYDGISNHASLETFCAQYKSKPLEYRWMRNYRPHFTTTTRQLIKREPHAINICNPSF